MLIKIPIVAQDDSLDELIGGIEIDISSVVDCLLNTSIIGYVMPQGNGITVIYLKSPIVSGFDEDGAEVILTSIATPYSVGQIYALTMGQ